jgi:hypothetical protein
MGKAARQKDISTRTENRSFSIADESKLPVQHIKGLVLNVVQVVWRGVARSRCLVDQGECAACRFTRRHDDFEVV